VSLRGAGPGKANKSHKIAVSRKLRQEINLREVLDCTFTSRVSVTEEKVSACVMEVMQILISGSVRAVGLHRWEQTCNRALGLEQNSTGYAYFVTVGENTVLDGRTGIKTDCNGVAVQYANRRELRLMDHANWCLVHSLNADGVLLAWTFRKRGCGVRQFFWSSRLRFFNLSFCFTTVAILDKLVKRYDYPSNLVNPPTQLGRVIFRFITQVSLGNLLVEPDGTGATHVVPARILSITDPIADIQTAFGPSPAPAPHMVLQGARSKCLDRELAGRNVAGD
jgi:hypothetical protein